MAVTALEKQEMFLSILDPVVKSIEDGQNANFLFEAKRKMQIMTFPN
jgi:hypothetical protein